MFQPRRPEERPRPAFQIQRTSPTVCSSRAAVAARQLTFVAASKRHGLREGVEEMIGTGLL